MAHLVGDRRAQVDASRAVDRGSGVRERDDATAAIGEKSRESLPDVAETLNRDSRALHPQAEVARCAQIAAPRPVASTRPSDPPISSGFPVTTAGTECPPFME